MRRAEGHKIVTDILSDMELQKGDTILLEYYNKDRFKKYFDFSDYKVVSINKGNFPKYLSADTTYKEVYRNGKDLYKDMFSSIENKHFESMLDKDILDGLKYGQSVVMVVLKSVAEYSPHTLNMISADDNLYSKQPLLFLVFSYIKNSTFEYLQKTLAVTKLQTKGNWVIIKFTKLNNP